MEHHRPSNKRHRGEISQRQRSDSRLPPKKKRMNEYPDASRSSSAPSNLTVKSEPKVSEIGFKEFTSSTPPRSGKLSPTSPPAMREVIDLSVDVVHKRMKFPTPDFPRFVSGDIYIELSSMDSNYSYCFHSITLDRVSPWFEREMQKAIHEPSEILAQRAKKVTGVRGRFELGIISLETNIGFLSRAPFTKVCEPEPNTKYHGLHSKIVPVSSHKRVSKLPSPPGSVAPEVRPLEGEVHDSVTPSPSENTAIAANPGLNIKEDNKPAMETQVREPAILCLTEQMAMATNPGPKVEEDDNSAIKTEKEETETTKEKEANALEMKMQKELKEAEIAQRTGDDATKMSKQKEWEEAAMAKATKKTELEEAELAKKRAEAAAAELAQKKELEETELAKNKAADAANGEKRQKLLEAYNNLFLTYYSKTPDIDQNDIQKALHQAELLAQLADFYGSIPIIRPHLNNAMMNFGREVYKAIHQDPPRWLHISLFLESAPIFKEAVLHIVGNYPHWLSETYDLPDLPSQIRAFLENKISELQYLKTEIDKKLFMSSIRVEGQEVKLDKKDKSTYNTWIIVTYWRDWFSRSLAVASTTRKCCIDANMYRLMAKGGDAYLELHSARTIIKALRRLEDTTGLAGQEIEEDLTLMKEFAQMTVKPLCVNHSMLSVEEENITYFTCTKVENDELPWVKKVEVWE